MFTLHAAYLGSIPCIHYDSLSLIGVIFQCKARSNPRVSLGVEQNIKEKYYYGRLSVQTCVIPLTNILLACLSVPLLVYFHSGEALVLL